MTEMTVNEAGRRPRRFRHRSRGSQVSIYLGKFLRMFVYQNEWKVLPMAAVIAGLVAMVIRSMLFQSMEGTMMGTLALTCVGIWNGCFNSIQVVCRERDVVKREHRSGMHISAYVMAHLIYQAMLCLLQTGLTMFICQRVGVAFPRQGMFSSWMIVDIGITLFLVTYASDVLSLWISSLAHSTTAAMTVMPFVLIFQLVFSGGMLTLPKWSEPLSDLAISRYGIMALSAQADYNNAPLASVWNAVVGMRDREISGTFTVGEAAKLLEDKNNPTVRELRDVEITRTMTVEEFADMAEEQGAVGASALLEPFGDKEVTGKITLGEAADYLLTEPEAESLRETPVAYSMTVGQIIDLVGWDRTRTVLQNTMAENRFVEEYVKSRGNIAFCWLVLLFYTGVYAALATITLEFIDKDKR